MFVRKKHSTLSKFACAIESFTNKLAQKTSKSHDIRKVEACNVEFFPMIFSGSHPKTAIVVELPNRMITASVHETTNNPSFILSEVSLSNCLGPTKTACKTKWYKGWGLICRCTFCKRQDTLHVHSYLWIILYYDNICVEVFAYYIIYHIYLHCKIKYDTTLALENSFSDGFILYTMYI